MNSRIWPVFFVLSFLIVVWCAAVVPMNWDQAQGLADDGASNREILVATFSLDRPVLPAPFQVAATLADAIFDFPIGSPRSLVFHAGVSAATALAGLALALVGGTLLAIGIVQSRVLDRAVMPWVIASQAIPVLAIAPMVVVVLGNLGLTGIVPKSLIAGWLSFLPITTGMVKGLRSPDPMQRDLLRTYSAGNAQVFAKLRWPASVFYLFPALKVAAPLALVGAIVAELPTGAQAGLGARLLAGSYYGQTLQIWAVLFAASLLAMALVALVDLTQALVIRRRAGGHDECHPAAVGGTRFFSAGFSVRRDGRCWRMAPPVVLGILVLWLWEVACRGYAVPRILLPAPSEIGAAIAGHLPMLAADFEQTFVRAVVPGWAIGSALGLLAAILLDFSQFLRRGFLPLAGLASAMPIVGVAPIMVMWFGFDWQSKAAVVVVMTFFPMLINAAAGLAGAGAMERDLMRSFAASGAQVLVKLRLPGAMPFVFNALKLNATLALIGAIVAEFFGTPIVGMGFRISTEAARLDMDVVWAEIAMAALAGTASFALLAGLERLTTFWHASFR